MIDYEIYFTGKVVKGELQGIPKGKLREELKQFEDQSVELIIRRKRKKRSSAQNRTYWMYVSILAEETGFSKDEFHEIIKMKFLKDERVDEKTGEVYPYLKSTSKLSTVEFNYLFEQLYQWAAETFHVTLPKPKEQIEMGLE